MTSGGIDEFELGDLRQPLLDGDAQFHAGEVRSGAAVDAGTEREVAVLLAVEDDLVGVGEHLGVTVGAGEVHQDALAGLDRTAVVLGVLDSRRAIVTGA